MTGAALEPQLTLDLFDVRRHDFAGFYPGANAHALAATRAWSLGQGPRLLYLWGPRGAGKSHLLQAATRAAGAGGRAMYLPLGELTAHGATVLEDLGQIEMLALDDLDAWRGNRAGEHALFKLVDERYAGAGRLVMAASAAPSTATFTLPDLSSRLSASLVFRLEPLADADKPAALAMLAARRGMVLPRNVIAFILRHERRDMAALVEILDSLDAAALSHGRALTLPFVREILELRRA